MRKVFLILLLPLALAGCNVNVAALLTNLADVEQSALEVVSRVRAGAKVAGETVDRTITSVCVTAVPGVSLSLQTFMASVPNPGPRTARAIGVARVSIDTAQRACTEYVTRPPSASGRGTVLLKLQAAYGEAKAALREANAAAGG